MPDLFPYSYRILKFDLTAGLTDQEIPIHAERIDYISPTDGPEIQIRLQLKGNDQIPLRPNGSIEAPFTRLYVSASATAKTISLMVGSPKDVQLTGRDVLISGFLNANSLKDYALSKGQLFEGAAQVLGVAAQWQTVMLLNPAGSGKKLTVVQVLPSSNAAGIQMFGLYYALFSSLPVTTLYSNLFNNTLGGAASSAQLRTMSNAAGFGSGPFKMFYLPATSHAQPWEVSYEIPEGYALMMAPPLTQNLSFNLSALAWERPA